MKNCKYCGAMLPDDARACSNCGRPTGYVPVKNADAAESSPEQKTAEDEIRNVRAADESSSQGNESKDAWESGSNGANDPWGMDRSGGYGGYRQNGPGPSPYDYGNRQWDRKTSGYAVASLALGVIAPLLNSFYFAPSVLAITFGVLAIVQCTRQSDLYKGKWMGITGIVLGGVFLVIYIILFIYAFKLLQDPEFASFFKEYMEEMANSGIRLR